MMEGGRAASSGDGTEKVSTTTSGSGGGAGGFGRGALATAGGALVTEVIGAHNPPGASHGVLQALANMAVATPSIRFLIFLNCILPPNDSTRFQPARRIANPRRDRPPELSYGIFIRGGYANWQCY
jgi:hypothetical protein